MVRLRLLAIASMVLVGAVQVSPMMGAQGSTAQKANEVRVLHTADSCAMCNGSIKDLYWPDVVVVRCNNDEHEHGMIVHTACAQTHKDTHECVTCKAKLSDESKKYIDHVLNIKRTPGALTDPKNPLYQFYNSTIRDAYRATVDVRDMACPICMTQLMTWPQAVVLHENHRGTGKRHIYCKDCLDKLPTRARYGADVYHVVECPECRQEIRKTTLDALRDSFGLEHIQKYEKLKDSNVARPVIPSKRSAVVDAVMKYRISQYPILCAAAAIGLHAVYVYGNAESLSVSEAMNGMFDSAFAGGCFGLVAAVLHYARDWYTAK